MSEQHSVGAWLASEKGMPEDGQVVLAHFPADEFGPDAWFVLEYHCIPARHEANRHVWHGPGKPDDDYSTPPYWQPLTKPAEPIKTVIHEYSFAPGIKFEVPA